MFEKIAYDLISVLGPFSGILQPRNFVKWSLPLFLVLLKNVESKESYHVLQLRNLIRPFLGKVFTKPIPHYFLFDFERISRATFWQKWGWGQLPPITPRGHATECSILAQASIGLGAMFKYKVDHVSSKIFLGIRHQAMSF